MSPDLAEEMAPNVFVSEDPIRVHLGHGGNKFAILWVEAAQMRGAERMRLRPVGSSVKGEHDLLEPLEEVLIAHRASIGPVKKQRMSG